jgi:5-methylcytosine-specific restriction endonuclease McrA
MKKGEHMSEEQKEMYSKSHQGFHHSEETKKKMSESHKGNNHLLGKHISNETKFKLSLINKGKPRSLEIKKKISESLKGKHPTEETRKKLCERKPGFLGKYHTFETKRKIGEASKGRIWSDETRKRVSELKKGKPCPQNKGKHASEETRKKMSLAQKGEKNPNWQGGISNELYTLDFNSRFRKIIKERDGCCMICNIGFVELHTLKRRIHIHHIDYDKHNSFPQNCITLCINCHSTTNANRNQWIPFFHSLLAERYKYQYTETQKILLDFTKPSERL